MVITISEECAFVPRGAVAKISDGTNVLNPMFEGLKASVATDLTNYQLYRTPHHDLNENLLKRPCYNYTTDFLDTLDAVQPPPQHSNVVSLDRYDEVVYIKSVLWPGMLFFHKCKTKTHGFVYFGNGRKNADLLFMIWQQRHSSSHRIVSSASEFLHTRCSRADARGVVFQQSQYILLLKLPI